MIYVTWLAQCLAYASYPVNIGMIDVANRSDTFVPNNPFKHSKGSILFSF